MGELTPYICVPGARRAIEWPDTSRAAAVSRDPFGHRWFLNQRLD